VFATHGSAGELPTQQFATSDAQRGATAYGQAYANCHGDQGQGLIGPNLIPRPELPRDWIADKIRHSSAPGMGGYMPFFGADRLTDQQVADIAPYLATRARPVIKAVKLFGGFRPYSASSPWFS
jgi:mono/diheme cytochrome c family protein